MKNKLLGKWDKFRLWVGNWLAKLPQNTQGARELGSRAAEAGYTVSDNPYADGGNFATSYVYRTSDCLTKKQELARAYYLGFGKVVWRKMISGCKGLPAHWIPKPSYPAFTKVDAYGKKKP